MTVVREVRKWSRGKVLAVVIPLVLVLAGGSAAVILILSRDKKESGSQDEITQDYQDISTQNDALMAELQALETQQAMQSAGYEQELADANDSLDQMEADVSEAAAQVEQAAADVSETNAEYQALYDSLLAYYAYLEQMLAQAEAQVQYLQAVAPTLSDMQQLQALSDRMSKLPPGAAQQNELMNQLSGTIAAMAGRASTAEPPASLAQSGEAVQSLTGELQSLAGQMAGALAAGNPQSLDALAGQIGNAISGVQAQLANQINGLLSSFISQLDSMQEQITTLLP